MKEQILALTLALAACGCHTLDKAGVYKGDTVRYESELQIRTAYDMIHGFVIWERKNRPLLAKWPEVTKAADKMRVNSKQWFDTANALHDAYVANPSPDGADKLKAAIAVLHTALTEASNYMVKVSQPQP
jgi:hypothetical protein